MRLTDLYEQPIWSGEIDGEKYTIVVNENTRGGILSATLRQGATAIKSNPGLAALGGGFAIASLLKYNQNKRNTMRLFAKTQNERRTYKKIVDDLMKTGSYKKVREKHVGGGYYWELKRK